VDVYIVVDMECISGITNGSMIRVGHSEWATRGRHLATAEVNAAIEGALAAGARRVWVKDGHDAGENLVREELHPAADLLSGTMAVPGFMPGLDTSFDALFLIGFHARMGTGAAHFDHTVSTATISEIRLNGTPVGEIGIYAAYAGFQNVPTVFVTGDTAGVQEALDLFGPAETVAVKQGLGRFSARVPAPEEIRPRIRSGAEQSLKAGGRPWRPDTPLHFAVDFLRSAEADMAEMVPGAVREGARTVGYRHDDPDMAFKALQAMISLGGIASNRWATALYTTGNRVV
jgi:D-amino peptidase